MRRLCRRPQRERYSWALTGACHLPPRSLMPSRLRVDQRHHWRMCRPGWVMKAWTLENAEPPHPLTRRHPARRAGEISWPHPKWGCGVVKDRWNMTWQKRLANPPDINSCAFVTTCLKGAWERHPQAHSPGSGTDASPAEGAAVCWGPCAGTLAKLYSSSQPSRVIEPSAGDVHHLR